MKKLLILFFIINFITACYTDRHPSVTVALETDRINTKDDQGNTPLHYAALTDDDIGARQLIAKGANIEAKNNNGDTPLMSATRSKSTDVIDILLKQGADINTRDNIGQTPMIVAVSNGPNYRTLRTTQLFIDSGANIHAVDKYGHNALWYANPGHDVLLQKYGATGRTMRIEEWEAEQAQGRAEVLPFVAPIVGAAVNSQFTQAAESGQGVNVYHVQQWGSIGQSDPNALGEAIGNSLAEAAGFEPVATPSSSATSATNSNTGSKACVYPTNSYHSWAKGNGVVLSSPFKCFNNQGEAQNWVSSWWKSYSVNVTGGGFNSAKSVWSIR